MREIVDLRCGDVHEGYDPIECRKVLQSVDERQFFELFKFLVLESGALPFERGAVVDVELYWCHLQYWCNGVPLPPTCAPLHPFNPLSPSLPSAPGPAPSGPAVSSAASPGGVLGTRQRQTSDDDDDRRGRGKGKAKAKAPVRGGRPLPVDDDSDDDGVVLAHLLRQVGGAASTRPAVLPAPPGHGPATARPPGPATASPGSVTASPGPATARPPSPGGTMYYRVSALQFYSFIARL